MPKNIAPAWMSGVVRDNLAQLDTDLHNKAIVSAIAVLGEDGFEFASRDNMHELDATAAITVLLEGYAMVSASGLVALIQQASRELRAAKDLPADRAEKMPELRVRVEAAIRHWLRSVMMYAGQEYQRLEGEKPQLIDGKGRSVDEVVMACSQVLGLWMGVATGDVASSSKSLDSELAGLRAFKEAYERSGLDVSPCMSCGESVVCVPDGMPMCETCADKEAEKQKGAGGE